MHFFPTSTFTTKTIQNTPISKFFTNDYPTLIKHYFPTNKKSPILYLTNALGVLFDNEVRSLVLHQHVLLHSGLGTKSKALRAENANGLEPPAFTLIQVSLLDKSLAFRTPLTSNSVGPKSLRAVEALIALVTTKLKEK